jgi:hypothetical protein
MRETAMPSRKAGRAAETPTGRIPMQTIRKTIRTLAMMATVLAGAALVSGAVSVAHAGGGYWTG